MRIDLLLSRLCLLKTRSQAGRACDAGRVRLNGRVAKAAADVRPGDRIAWIDPLGRFEHEVEVLALPAGSVSRAQARELYREVARRRFDPTGDGSGAEADAP